MIESKNAKTKNKKKAIKKQIRSQPKNELINLDKKKTELPNIDNLGQCWDDKGHPIVYEKTEEEKLAQTV